MAVKQLARLAGWLLLALGAAALMLAPTNQKQPPKDREVVRYWHMWTGEWEDVVNRVVDRFNASQDEYWVEALSVPPGGADSKFLLAVAGGDPPDVMAQWNPVIPTFAEGGLIQPLDELMTPEEKRQFDELAYAIVKKVGTYESRLYGITIGLNAAALYVLPEHLRAAGLDPAEFPETLEELDEWGDRLHQFDEQGRLKRLGYIPGNFATMAALFGGGFYDEATGEVTIDRPENLAALKYIVERRKKLGFDEVLRFNAGLDTGSFTGGWPFIGGAYSITIDGQWRVEQLRKFAPELEYATFPMPSPKGGPKLAGVSGGNFMIIPKGAKNVEGAWEFIKFWSGLKDPEVAAEFYTWGGWLPLWPPVAEAPVYQEYLRKYPQFRTFLEILPSENLQTVAPVPYTVFLNDRIARAEDLAVRGTLTPEEAIERLEREVQQEVARRKELGYDD